MDELLSRIRRQLPELEWRCARVEGGGWDHFALILDEAVVFRIPKAEVDVGHFEHEIALLELVASHTSIRVPDVSHVSPDRTIIGYPYLQGDQLSRAALDALDDDHFELVCEQHFRRLFGSSEAGT